MSAGAPQAQAQSLLRGIANKAKDAVKEKVTNKVEAAVGKALGVPQNSAAQTSQGAESNSTTDSGDYANTITPEKWVLGCRFTPEKYNDTGEYDSNGDPILRISRSTYHFASGAEALAALPALPTVKQIVYEGEEGPVPEAFVNYALGYYEFYQRHLRENEERAMRSADYIRTHRTSGTVSLQKDLPATAAFTDKMMEAIVKSGLDIQKASEAELTRVVSRFMSKEFGVPEAEMAKLIQQAQKDPEAAMAYLAKHYPEAARKMGVLASETAKVRKNQDDGTLDKYADLMEEVGSLSSDEELMAASQRAAKVGGELEAYANELLQQWPKSEAFARVEAMEKELNQKLNAYMETSGTNYNDEAPDFWVEGRKAQNAVIDAYNEQMAQQWCAKLQGYIDEFTPYARRVTDLEARFDSAASDVGNLSEAIVMQFQTVAGTFSFLGFNVVYSLPAMSLDAPCLAHVLEQWLP